MPVKKSLTLLINAKDHASKVIKGIGGTVKKAMGIAAKGLAGAGAAAAGTTTAMLGFAKSSAKKAQLKPMFWERFGGASSGALEKLRDSAKGTISDMDLMQTANRAALLGVADNVEDLSGLMKTARLRGKSMGMTTTEAFNDIVTGIGRGSPLILDNLGIKIPDAIKDLKSEMTDAEYNQRLLQYAMEDGAKIAEKLGGDVVDSADRFARFKAGVANLKQKLGEAFMPFADAVMTGINAIITGLTESGLFKALQDTVTKVTSIIKLFTTGNYTEAIGEVLGVGEDSPLVTKILNFRDTLSRVFQTITGVIRAFLTGNFSSKQFLDNMGLKPDGPIVTLLKTTRETISSIWNSIVQVFTKTSPVAVIIANFDKIKTAIVNFSKTDLFKNIVRYVKLLITGFKNFGKAFIGGVKENWDVVVDVWKKDLKPAFTQLGDTIGKVLGDVIDTEGDTFLEMMTTIGGVVAKVVVKVIAVVAKIIAFVVRFSAVAISVFQKVRGRIQSFINVIVNIIITFRNVVAFIKSIPQRIQTFVNNAIEFLRQLPRKLLEFIGMMLAHIINFVLTAPERIRKFKDKVVKFFKQLPGQLSKVVTNLVKSIGDFVSKSWNKIKGFKDKVIKFFTETLPDKISNGFQGVKDFFANLPSHVVSGINSMIDKFESGINTLIDGFNKAAKEMPKIGTISKVNFGRIGGKQFGGLASGVTLVGEAGPELVDLPAGSQVYSNQSPRTQQARNAPVVQVTFAGEVRMDSSERVDELVRKFELAIGNEINLELIGG
jgi:phage-related protein